MQVVKYIVELITPDGSLIEIEDIKEMAAEIKNILDEAEIYAVPPEEEHLSDEELLAKYPVTWNVSYCPIDISIATVDTNEVSAL